VLPTTDFCTQVCDIIDGLFVSIFKHLNENCKKELETINKQYPFEPLKVKLPYYFVLLSVRFAQAPISTSAIYAVSGENLEANVRGRDSNAEGSKLYSCGHFVITVIFALVQHAFLVLFSLYWY
jgi:aspartyl/asparaginyl-tRNA synthetase